MSLPEGRVSPSRVARRVRRLSGPRLHVLLLLLAFLGLGVFYSLVTPPLEASDEFDHYPYVQYLQTRWALPVMDPQDPEPWRQEGGQPPLYYLLMAGVTSWIDTDDVAEVRWLNRHAFIGIPGQVDNKNLVIHRPEREAFPWQGTVLAVHVIRLASVLLGAVAVWLVWQVAAQLCPASSWVPLLAAALTAFNPMFLFISAAVNNDVLAVLLGSLSLLLVIRLWNSDVGWRRAIRDLVVLGLVLGLGALTKLSLVAMIPLALLVVALRTWRRYADTALWRRAAFVVACCTLVLLAAVAVSSWWYVRNWRLYGDPMAVNVFMEILGYREEPFTFRGLLGEFGTFRRTYWGLFGGVNVAAPELVYAIYDVLVVVAIFGLVLRVWRRRPVRIGVWWVPTLWVGIIFAALVRWVMMYYSFQGRLVFPSIAAISTFLALGLGEWIAPHRRPAVVWAITGGLAVLALVVPFVSIMPAYVNPQPLTPDEVPVEARVEPVDVAGVARVVGWELAPQVVRPGDLAADVDCVVYWEAVAPDGQDYVSFAKLLGRDHQLVGQVNRHPASGMVPTSLWEPGQVWRDRYRVPVTPGAAAPTRLRIDVGLYDPQEGRDLGVVRLGEAKLSPPRPVRGAVRPLAVELTQGIALRGYDLSSRAVVPGEAVTLALQWEALSKPPADYQVFVHLFGGGTEPVAQADGPPLSGDYPTSMWAPGERVNDPHVIVLPEDLPPGQYRVLVGMYSLETMERLARLDGAGDAIEIPDVVEVR